MLKNKVDSTYKGRLVVQVFSQILGMNAAHHHEKEIITISQRLYGGGGTALRCGRMKTRVHYRSRAGTAPEPTGGESAKRGGETALPGDHWSCDVPRTNHPLRHPLRGQSAGEGHVQAHESSHGGGDPPASLLGRVHTFPITYKQGGFRLAVFSDANWGIISDNGRSTSSYIVTLANAPIIFKSGTAEADRTVHDGGTARGGSSENEGGGVLLQHDVGIGLR